MSQVSKFVGQVVVGLVATSGVAFAAPLLVPEPDSIALVGVALAALVAVLRKDKNKK